VNLPGRATEFNRRRPLQQSYTALAPSMAVKQ